MLTFGRGIFFLSSTLSTCVLQHIGNTSSTALLKLTVKSPPFQLWLLHVFLYASSVKVRACIYRGVHIKVDTFALQRLGTEKCQNVTNLREDRIKSGCDSLTEEGLKLRSNDLEASEAIFTGMNRKYILRRVQFDVDTPAHALLRHW